jgi:two-component system, NtrC family, sensor kinase
MKTIISIILALIVSNYTYTQESDDVIKLKKELKQANQKTSKVDIMIDLSLSYRFSNRDSSLLYAQKAISVSRKIDYKKGEMNALTRIGNIAISQGDIAKGLNNSLNALRIAEENNLFNDAQLVMNTLGGCYRRLGNYPEAIKFFRKQIVVSKDHKLGEVYGYLGLARVFQETGQLDSAIFNAHRAQTIFLEINIIEPSLSSIIGLIEFEKGKYHSALKFFNTSLEESDSIKDYNRKPSTLINIAKVYQVLNKRDSSILFAKEGLKFAEQMTDSDDTYKASKFLAELYEDKDNKEALAYLKKATALNDSVYSKKSLQDITDITNSEQERLREIEAAKLSYQNKLKQYGFLAGLGFLTIVAFLLYRNNRRKHKDNVKLQSQKEEIESTLSKLKTTQAQLIQSEKMASLGELTAGIAHEIQNPLNFVNNFSEVSNELIDEMNEELDKGDIEEAKAISADIKQNLEKINHHGNRASSIVKGMLEHSRTSSGKKELTDINALADEYLRLAYHGLRAKDKDFNADFETQFDPNLPKIEVIPQDIGRVLLNLINNAFQAVQEKSSTVSESYQPMVKVSTELTPSSQESLSRSSGGRAGGVLITITDNGFGIPDEIKDKIFQPFFTTKDTGKGTGLGLSLAYDIVKAHSGELRAESPSHRGKTEGITFIINLPILNNQL